MLVFCKEDIEVKERSDLMSPTISTVWLEYRSKNGAKNLICFRYREFNPCTDEADVDTTSINEQLSRFQVFEEQVRKASKECSSVYVLGDLNLDLNKFKDKNYYLRKISNEYESLVGECGLEITNFGITWRRIFNDGT